MIMYSLEHFESFTANALPENIFAIIDTLSNVLSNNASMTNNCNGHKEPSTNKYKHNRNRSGGNVYGHHSSSIFSRNDTAVADKHVFKITMLEQKDGIEKIFNDIQILLNKLSVKNYLVNSEKIFELVNINQLYENDDSLRKIGDFVFTVVSQNTFFSEIYANLFIQFVEKFSVFQTILFERVETYATSFQNFKYVEQSSNYEEYCVFNKNNDAKKSTAVFFNHLMNKDILPKEYILKIVSELQNIIMSNMENTTTNMIDELFEFLSIFMSNTQITLYDNCPNLVENVRTISKIAPRECKAISSRTIFKAIELLDKIEKTK